MSDNHYLDSNWELLVNNLRSPVIHPILDRLRSRVLSPEEYDTVYSFKGTDQDKVRILLPLVSSRGEPAIQLFKEAIQELNSELYERMEQTEDGSRSRGIEGSSQGNIGTSSDKAEGAARKRSGTGGTDQGHYMCPCTDCHLPKKPKLSLSCDENESESGIGGISSPSCSGFGGMSPSFSGFGGISPTLSFSGFGGRSPSLSSFDSIGVTSPSFGGIDSILPSWTQSKEEAGLLQDDPSICTFHLNPYNLPIDKRHKGPEGYHNLSEATTEGELHKQIQELQQRAAALTSECRMDEAAKVFDKLLMLTKRRDDESKGELGFRISLLSRGPVQEELQNRHKKGKLREEVQQYINQIVHDDPDLLEMDTDIKMDVGSEGSNTGANKGDLKHQKGQSGIIKVHANMIKLRDDYILEDGKQGAVDRLFDHLVDNPDELCNVIHYLNSFGVQVSEITRGCIELKFCCLTKESADQLQEEYSSQRLHDRFQNFIETPTHLEQFGLESVLLDVKCTFVNKAPVVDMQEEFDLDRSSDFARGDLVKISVSLDELMSLQEEHGGYITEMEKVIDEPGHVSFLDHEGDIHVRYLNNRMCFNPAALTKFTSTEDKFYVGDLVQIESDLQRLKSLQTPNEYGGYVEEMAEMCGKTGRLLSIVDSKKMRVKVQGRVWIFNPELLRRIGNPRTDEGSSVGNKSGIFEDNIPDCHPSTTSLADMKMEAEKEVDDADNQDTGVICVSEAECCSCQENEAHLDQLHPDKVLFTRKGENINFADKDGRTPLWIAAQSGLFPNVEMLLSKGADVNKADKDGRTPLWIVLQQGYHPLWMTAQNGHLPTVKALLTKGADVNMADKDGRTPLWLAAQKGHLPTVEMLLCKGADFNMADRDGRTPLWIAAQNGYLPVVETLLSKGTDIHISDKYGQTPLWLAAQKGHLPAVELLLSKGADVNMADRDGRTPLLMAVQNGHLGRVKMLVCKGATVKKTGRYMHSTPQQLWMTGEQDFFSTIEMLLRKGAYANMADKDGRTPLWIAAQQGHLCTVETLLSKGADVNMADKDGRTPLWIAAQNGHLPAVEMLLCKGADVNMADKYGRTPLWIAAQKGHLTTVEILLGKGADVDIKDNMENTLLKVALDYGQLAIANSLINHGADSKFVDINFQDVLWQAAHLGLPSLAEMVISKHADVNMVGKDGKTPLGVATKNGHLPTVEMLLSKGADVNMADKDGQTPLWIAAQGGHLPAMQLLITNGSNVNITDNEGRTLFSTVVQHGCRFANLQEPSRCNHLPILDLLINKGADINAAKKNGQTSLWIAAEQGHLPTVEMLLSKGANVNMADKDGRTPLWIAANKDHLCTVEMLLSMGADVNMADKDGRTPLLAAIEQYTDPWGMRAKGNLPTVEMLLSKGAEVNMADKDDRTPLWIAAKNGQLPIVEMLLGKGADVNKVDKDGRTPLGIAVQNCHLKTVEILVTEGADINMADKEGRTPLWIAAQEGLLSRVEMLFSKATGVNKAGKDGTSPADAAKSKGRSAVEKIVMKNDIKPITK